METLTQFLFAVFWFVAAIICLSFGSLLIYENWWIKTRKTLHNMMDTLFGIAFVIWGIVLSLITLLDLIN